MTPKTSIGPDTAMKVRIRGVSFQMNRFRYLYEIILGKLLLKHANNLSWTLQHTSLLPRRSPIKSGLDEAVETHNGIWGDEKVDLFWTKVTGKAGAVDVGEPALLRRRKTPIRFDYICCVKETSRKQLRQRTNSRPIEAVGRQFRCCDSGAMDIFHVKEYFLSLSQGQRSHFSSSFSSFLQRMLHQRDCSLRYDIPKATCAPLRCWNVWTIWCCCTFTMNEQMLWTCTQCQHNSLASRGFGAASLQRIQTYLSRMRVMPSVI